MAWFGSVSGKQVDEFARTLARELAQEYPPTLDAEASSKALSQKLARALRGIFDKARDYREQNRLGVYKKARLANTFRWEIKEMGYSDKFVEAATEGLVVNMTRKK